MAPQNSDVTSLLEPDLAQCAAETSFNNPIQRVTADHQARHCNGISNVPPTTGDLRVPTVSLHTLGDLFVPFQIEIEYARRVKAKDWSHKLVQRSTLDYGYRPFTPTELVQSFDALTGWVEGGVKPAGDNVLDPAQVAAPNFGCKGADKVRRREWNTVPALAFLKPPSCPAT